MARATKPPKCPTPPSRCKTICSKWASPCRAISSARNIQLKNVAAVIVTAELPAFAQPGQQIDVVVSSMGNAKSLKGGTLITTPLRGADGEIYALAQGNMVVGGMGPRPVAARCKSTT